MHARLAWPGCGRPSTPAWRRPASGQPWPLVSRPSSSSWPPSRSRCWCPATARRAARARRPTRRRAIRQERRERRSPLTRPRRLRPRRLRLRSPPRLRRSPPRLRPVPRRAAHPDTQGITAAEPGNLVQRPTAPNTQICAPRETSAQKPSSRTERRIGRVNCLCLPSRTVMPQGAFERPAAPVVRGGCRRWSSSHSRPWPVMCCPSAARTGLAY
jgi:hypothetical protein